MASDLTARVLSRFAGGRDGPPTYRLVEEQFAIKLTNGYYRSMSADKGSILKRDPGGTISVWEDGGWRSYGSPYDVKDSQKLKERTKEISEAEARKLIEQKPVPLLTPELESKLRGWALYFQDRVLEDPPAMSAMLGALKKAPNAPPEVKRLVDTIAADVEKISAGADGVKRALWKISDLLKAER